MGHGGITAKRVIRNGLLYSFGDRCVSVGHGGMRVKDSICNSLLCSVGDK